MDRTSNANAEGGDKCHQAETQKRDGATEVEE